MSSLQSFQAMLTLKLNEIDAICHDWGYNASPTLLLRHPDGAAKSILLSNDSLIKVVLCIAELADTGPRCLGCGEVPTCDYEFCSSGEMYKPCPMCGGNGDR
jgi:hypothetical protein